MKVNGNILLDKNGTFSNINPHNVRCAIYDFASMIKEANKCKDTLYYDNDEWEQFHAKGYTPNDPFWHNAGNIAFAMLFNLSNPMFKPIQIGNTNVFNSKPEPRTLGGFWYDGCTLDNYVHDEKSINKWHYDWLYKNPQYIEWGDNILWPRLDLVVNILKEELTKQNLSIPKKDIDVANVFHDEVMKHYDNNRIRSRAQEIVELLCKANYYHREKELERLEKNKGNKCAEIIFSIKKYGESTGNGKYQFISIDKQHGMLELCDDKGEHLGEYRFDGTPNGQHTQESDHSLLCVNDWKKQYNK